MKNMKRFAAAAAALLLALVSTTACGDNKSSSTSSTSSSEEEADGLLIPNIDTNNSDVPVAADGPKLYFTDTTAGAGEIAEVSLCVKDADKKWAMCGIHVTFSDALECQMEDEEEGTVLFEKGEASKKTNQVMCMIWKQNLPEELTSQHLGSLFFTEFFKGNDGQDGEIAKFYFKIPENAESGTQYPIGIYYVDGNDLFLNQEQDASFQKYAFDNWKGGTITVK